MQKVTYLDFPGKIATMIFTVWCNMRCKYCYNSRFVMLQKKHENTIPEKDFFSFLEERKWFLEWVVVCWWEPTIHKELPEFISKIKDMWYAVKLDTNWSNPTMIKNLIDAGLVDYIAMDIKDSFDTMTALTQSHIDLQHSIKESIDIINQSGIEYEFRTTVTKPYHTSEKIQSIAKLIQWKKRYYLQNFFPTATMIDPYFEAKKFSHTELVDLQEMANQYITTSIRE